MSFNPGKYLFLGKPFSVQEEEVFIQVEGGELVSLISDSSNESTKIIIVAEEQTKGKIYLIFPLLYLDLNYLYQYFWEPDKNVPAGTLLVDITNEGQEPIPESHFIISGKEFIFGLKPYETKRLVVDEFQAVRAEKISRYNLSLMGIPMFIFLGSLCSGDILFPAKIECFEGSTSGVVFLGEAIPWENRLSWK